MTGEVIGSQMYYIYFVYGLAFVLLSAICLVIRQNDQRGGLRWGTLAVFGFSHGIYQWMEMLALTLGDSGVFAAVRLGVLALSFVVLLEFAWDGWRRLGGWAPGRWMYMLFLLGALSGVLSGLSGLNTTIRYALGLPAALWTAVTLFRAMALSEKRISVAQEVVRASAETLRQERNLLRTLIDQLPDFIYVKDTAGRFLVVNKAVANLMGAATPDDLLGKTDTNYYSSAVAEQYRADEQQVIESGIPMINKDEPHADPAGMPRAVLTTKIPMRDPQGKIVGLVGISRDITERKQAEEEIQQSNLRLTQVLDGISALLERLFENTHVLFVHLDARFNILRVNQAYAAAYQRAADDFAGRNYFELTPHIGDQSLFEHVLTTGEPYVIKAQSLNLVGVPMVRKAFWDWSLQPVRNERGQTEGLLLCLLDVTRRKRAQQARVVSERKYRTLIENVETLIMRWSPDGTVTFANRFARRFLGFPAGKFAHDLAVETDVAAKQRVIAVCPPFLRDGSQPLAPQATWETEHARPDGRVAWIRWTSHAIRGVGGSLVEILGVGTDVTEHKQKELEMQRIQQQLRAFTRTTGTTLKGRAVSPGLAEGEALLCLPPESAEAGLHPITRDEVEQEIERFDRALDSAVRELENLRGQVVSKVTDEETTLIEAHLTMLQDVSFAEKCKLRVREGLVRVEQAVTEEVRALEEMLQGMEQSFMKERSADIRDIGRRVLWNLRAPGEQPGSRLKKLPPGTILVAEQLLPSDTLQMDRAHVVAFVTERNGPASHVAILARAMGIPAVCDVRHATTLLSTGDRLLVDADAGTVTVAPTQTQSVRFAARRMRHAAHAAAGKQATDQGCATRDGIGVFLHANIGQPDEARLVREYGLEGIGLFRSEFLFLGVDAPPDENAQEMVYASVAQVVQPHPVTIRTMDLGGDKLPRFAHTAEDLQLRLGRRGLAYSLTEKTMFRTQIRAILRVARQADVRLMFPMVLGVADLREARHMVDEAIEAEQFDKRMPIGVMIETPSAVFEINAILELVDFVSIGTNDLAQYILAEDRTSPEQRGARSFLYPGVLRATVQVVRAAAEHGIELSVCGEAAGDPATACLLVGMGVRNLSMSPFMAAPVRQAIRQLTVEQAENMAHDALAASTPQEVEAIVAGLLPMKPQSAEFGRVISGLP